MIVFINDIAGIAYIFHFKRDNAPLLNLQLLFETLLLSYFFFRVFSNNILKKVLSFFTILFVLTWIYFIYSFGIKKNLDFVSNFQNILILITTLLYFYDQVIKINTPFIYKEPRFWIVSAYFIYFSGIFFLFIYIPTLPAKDLESNYQITYIFTFIRSLLLSVAMILKPMKDNFNNNFSVRQKNFV